MQSERSKDFFHLTIGWMVFFGMLVLLMALTSNPVLSIASVLALPIFMVLLWRTDEPPVLLFAVFFQWMQVTAKIFHADLLGVSLRELTQIRTIELAASLALVGLVVLVVGIHIMLSRVDIHSSHRHLDLERISLDRLFVVCLISTILFQFVVRSGAVPLSYRQVVLSVIGIRWALIYVLGYSVIKRKEKYVYYTIIFVLEFIGGIGFFSGFKSILFVTLIILFTTSFPIRRRTLISTSIIVVAMFFLGLAWTSVKMEYRNYLNSGTRMQVINVSRAERLTKIIELIGDLDANDLKAAMEPLFLRLAYIDYFAMAIEYVPSYTPYENGGIWGASILHVLRPRFLFPDKGRLPSDSEMTMRYTGEHLASYDEGTSISMGYMAESYIDFGKYGMYMPIFILGILWGTIYLYFASRKRMTVFAYGLSTTILISTYQFEMAGIKLLGSVLMKFILLAFIFQYVMPHLREWFEGNQKRQGMRDLKHHNIKVNSMGN